MRGLAHFGRTYPKLSADAWYANAVQCAHWARGAVGVRHAMTRAASSGRATKRAWLRSSKVSATNAQRHHHRSPVARLRPDTRRIGSAARGPPTIHQQPSEAGK